MKNKKTILILLVAIIFLVATFLPIKFSGVNNFFSHGYYWTNYWQVLGAFLGVIGAVSLFFIEVIEQKKKEYKINILKKQEKYNKFAYEKAYKIIQTLHKLETPSEDKYSLDRYDKWVFILSKLIELDQLNKEITEESDDSPLYSLDDIADKVSSLITRDKDNFKIIAEIKMSYDIFDEKLKQLGYNASVFDINEFSTETSEKSDIDEFSTETSEKSDIDEFSTETSEKSDIDEISTETREKTDSDEISTETREKTDRDEISTETREKTDSDGILTETLKKTDSDEILTEKNVKSDSNDDKFDIYIDGDPSKDIWIKGYWILKKDHASQAKYLIGVSTKTKRVLRIFELAKDGVGQYDENTGRILFNSKETLYSHDETDNPFNLEELKDWTSMNPIIYLKYYLNSKGIPENKKLKSIILDYDSLDERDIIVVRTQKFGK